MRELVLSNPIAGTFSHYHQFSALTSLRLWNPRSPTDALDLVSATSNTLQALSITAVTGDLGNAPARAFSLPNLRSLSIYAGQRTEQLGRHFMASYMPRLDHLAITSVTTTILLPLLEKVAGTVTAVSLCGPGWGASNVGELQALRNTERLIFEHSAKEFLIDYTVNSHFFDQHRLWVQQTALPKLRSVEMTSDGSIELTNGGNILEFVRWRTVDLRRTYSNDAMPCRLTTFSIRANNAPAWMVSETERLLASPS